MPRHSPLTRAVSAPQRPARRRLPSILAALAILAAPGAGAFDAAPPLLPAQGTVQGTVQALFSPWQDVEGALVAAIGEGRRSIHVQAFAFTSRTLAAALIAAHRRGLRVEVLADRGQAERLVSSRLPQLAAAGIPVALEVRYAAAHNKILLIDAEEDSPTVITGSYNFTWSAQARNAENVLILRGQRELAGAYLDNWRRHRADAVPWRDYLRIED